MKDKTYRVEITRSQTLSLLITDKSAMDAIARANLYANVNETAFSEIPFEVTRRKASIVHNISQDPVDVDVDLTGETNQC